ncbi:Uncharacterised protein [BD1-7 clade bacterium]|uniref:Uncharacterized protein n=1 Tax=BD1-7 clade bacterium TaxID=2029982 RepID=A0A5S9PYP6_9GAMM|nr:Uncharacterised protein [BD1-7 clade bacterium]CAA0110237.1 Uncharacterised protein [BD1-7 clade bacterium]
MPNKAKQHRATSCAGPRCARPLLAALNAQITMVSNSRSQEKFTKFILVCFVIGYGSSTLMFLSIDGGTGSGGAFQAMLAMIILVSRAVVTTFLGVIALFTSALRQSWLKEGVFNSYWLPLLLSSPPIIWLLWQYVFSV